MQARNVMAIGLIGAVSMMAISAYAKEMPAQEFVQKASVASEFEIEASNLALQQSHNDDVKAFAKRMVDDHTKIGDNLKKTLQDANLDIKPAETLDEKHQDLLDKLDEASAKDFDREYIDMQKNAHKEAVGLFSDYAKHGKDKPLKSFASETLPTLKTHLKHVEHLKTEG